MLNQADATVVEGVDNRRGLNHAQSVEEESGLPSVSIS
jgi:hypothetical protein